MKEEKEKQHIKEVFISLKEKRTRLKALQTVPNAV